MYLEFVYNLSSGLQAYILCARDIVEISHKVCDIPGSYVNTALK